MPRTLTVRMLVDARGVAQAVRQPVYSLRVMKGPDLRRERRLGLSRARIGSQSGADFLLTDPTVSAVHCEIAADLSGFRVRDLGSKNGVSVGGRRVQEAWLQAKDDLLLGGTTVRFRVLDEEEERPLAGRTSLGKLIGSSARMREVYDQLARAASSDATLLIQGETGTGKELAADAVVSTGPRAEKPFVVLNCGALPHALAEAELFGHDKGAFTGAASSRAGAFERAHGGTLFLDEVSELPKDLQPKLLRALERKTVQRLGGSGEIAVDVRVIAASQRELEREVNRGAFRSDLFYRLAVVEIWMPALREHPEDIPALVAHFIHQLPYPAELPPAVISHLCQGEYPGNVRQLRNAVERAALGMDIPSRAAAAPTGDVLSLPFRLQKERAVAAFERDYMAKLLAACRGNVSEAARRSGMNRVHLYEVLQRLGLNPRAFAEP